MPRLLICGSLVVCSLILSGCATLQILSLGASSISYAVTGKSLSDHAISEVLDQDCALHRVALGEEACNEFETAGILRSAKSNEDTVLLISDENESYWQDRPVSHPSTNAAVEKLRSTEPQIQSFQTNQSPDEVVIKLMAEQQSQKGEDILAVNSSSNKVATRPMSDLYVEVGVTEKPQLFAVLGSYNDLNYARESLQAFPTLNAKVIINPDSGSSATRYRVVTGPMSESEFVEKLDPNLDAWRLQLCSNSYTRPPCENPMLAQHIK